MHSTRTPASGQLSTNTQAMTNEDFLKLLKLDGSTHVKCNEMSKQKQSKVKNNYVCIIKNKLYKIIRERKAKLLLSQERLVILIIRNNIYDGINPEVTK